MHYSGRDGSLYADGVRIARVSNWALSSSVETLETTHLGSSEKTYIPGIKSAQGTCSIYYHDDDPVPLLKRVLTTDAVSESDTVRLSLRWGKKKVDIDAIITKADLTCQVGAVMQAALGFTVTGNYQDLAL